jgi:hypothetical protein
MSDGDANEGTADALRARGGVIISAAASPSIALERRVRFVDCAGDSLSSVAWNLNKF